MIGRGPAAGPAAALLAVTALLTACTSSGGSSGSTSPAPRTSATSPDASSAAPATTATPAAPDSQPSSAPARLTRHDGLAVPDPDATPGSALAGVTRTQICTKGWNAAHNNIGVTVQNAVSMRYGMVAGGGTSLHFDQLIPASLGGDVTVDNVWPQPMSQTRRKNQLESHLHQLVCSGQLPLSTAQQAMADDWTAALRRYPPG